MKNIFIFVLLGALFWFGSAIVRLENIRYANDLSMCQRFEADRPSTALERYNCLDSVETRTSFFWHLLYGLRVF